MTLYYSDPNVPKHFGSYWTPSQWQWGLTEQDVQTHGTGQPLTVAKGPNGLRIVNAGNNKITNSTVTASTTYPTGSAMTEALRQRSYTDALPGKRAYMAAGGASGVNNGFWDNVLEGFGNLAKTNPMAFITTPIDIWSAFANYRANKQALNMYQDQLNLQREVYEKNEARNQRRFDMLEQARATSQL